MKIAFFGDSLTEGISGAAYFKLLQQNLPQHELFNFGRGGDTVISLHRRVARIDMPSFLDMAFLWVGVNDVLVNTSWTYVLLKLYRRQPWARRLNTFAGYYQLLLEQLSPAAGHVVAVSPHLIGEDLDNPWNRKLAELCRVIKTGSGNMPGVSFIDLQAVFRARLEGKPVSAYIPRNALRFLHMAYTRKNHRTIPQRTSEPKLHLTVDGVHLNAEGAELVANAFSQKIRAWEARKGTPYTNPNAD